jgi:hypothetical protein
MPAVFPVFSLPKCYEIRTDGSGDRPTMGDGWRRRKSMGRELMCNRACFPVSKSENLLGRAC